MTTPEAAQRMQGLGVSASMGVARKARELRRQGKEVIDFNTRPDAPARAKDAAVAMLRSPANASYTDPRGLPALRQAIAAKVGKENGIDADPDANILVTAGAMGGLSAVLLALVGPDDHVLVDDPCFHAFNSKVRIASGTTVRVPLLRDDGFNFSIDALRERVTPRTKLLFLCNPDNPTGMVRTRSELQAIAEAADEFDFYVLVDEAYEHFVYDGHEHVSMASLVAPSERIITVQSVSKTFHMHGWRVGWIVADEKVLEPIMTAHNALLTCPTSYAQAGVVAALEDSLGEGDIPIPELVSLYQEKRDVMVRGLNGIPGVSCPQPQGAYFAFPSFSDYDMSSVDMCTYLLDVGLVASTPGSAFGSGGEGRLRLNCNSPLAEIERGVGQIAVALSKLSC
jgi:aspartate/methionine/tyrosine aminotransferase